MKSTIRAARTAALAIALVACSADRLVAPTATSSAANRASASLGTQLVITEIMIRPTLASDPGGEWFELYNGGTSDVDLKNYRIMSFAGATIEKHTIASSVIVPAGRCVVLGNSATNNGGVSLAYAYGSSIGFANSNQAEALWLRSPDSLVVYDSVAATVRTQTGFDRPFSIGSNFSLELRQIGSGSHFIFTDTSAAQPWKQGTSAYFTSGTSSLKGTPGVCPPGSLQQAGPLATITIAPTSASVVKGSSTQLRATGADAAGIPVDPAVTWSTPDGSLVSLAPAGNDVTVTGNAVGDATIVATSTSGVTREAVVHIVAPPPPPPPLPSTRVSEFHYDNNGNPDVNEAIEIEGNAGVDLSGWSLVLYTGNGGTVYNTISLSGTIAGTCNGRGAISFPAPGLQNGGFTTEEPDGFALVNGTTVVQFLSYEGTFTAADGPAAGMTSTDVGVEESGSTTSTQSIQLNTAGTWENRAANFGLVNACATNIGVASISISHNGPDTLVVGWQRRAFVTYKDANGTTVSPTPTITWTSDTPGVATVDALGYATGVSAGTAIIRATIGSTTGTYSFKVINYEPVVAQYGNHVEFGVPTGADASNNVMLTKAAYVTSYNPSRGGPNWVSWNINASTFGDAERCECFSPDTTLGAKPTPDIAAANWINDQDYIGTGGYDRGHMVQSESRTSTASENAATFLMTNILPQASNNNQGAWLGFEEFLNARAQVDHKQVYVVAGGEYAAHPGTLANSNGRVAIPDYTWKVAIVVNNGGGLSGVHGLSDITMYAVRIPNLTTTAPATKSKNYSAYVTTVDAIEAKTGYDFFAALPDNIENVLEADDHAPTAAFTAPATSLEGATVSFDASISTDPDAGDVLSYAWTFSNGATSTSAAPSVVFTDDGTYTANLTVTDKYGATSTLAKNITVSNVAPTVAAFAGATILRGETYSSNGTFSDPGSDTHTATVNYGDGSGAAPLALGAGAFSLSHAYSTSGTFTVTAIVTDDDGGSASRTATVTVLSAASAIGVLSGNVDALATAGTLTSAEAHELAVSLDAALKSIEKGNTTPAGNQLGAFINKVEALRSSGRISAATAQALIDYANRAIASIG